MDIQDSAAPARLEQNSVNLRVSLNEVSIDGAYSDQGENFVLAAHPSTAIKEVAECMLFGCRRCQSLDEPVTETGTLYINPAMATTQVSLRRFFREQSIPFSEPYNSIMAVNLYPAALNYMSAKLPFLFSETELANCRSLIMADGVTPSIIDLVKMESLQIILSRWQGRWLTEVLRESRVFTEFQPIVHGGEPAKVFGYECLLRGRSREGEIIAPNRLFAMAKSGDLLYQLDRVARLTAIGAAHRHKIASNVFINFDPSAIDEPSHCLQATLRAVAATNLRPEQIVFEVVESSQSADVNHLLKLLSYYRDRGFRVALDDMGAGYGSLNLLTQVRPDFIKLDIQLIKNVDRDEYKSQVAAKIVELAQSLGVQTIAEGVETEGEWNWVKEHGAEYAQGFYFARPASPPPLFSQV